MFSVLFTDAFGTDVQNKLDILSDASQHETLVNDTEFQHLVLL